MSTRVRGAGTASPERSVPSSPPTSGPASASATSRMRSARRRHRHDHAVGVASGSKMMYSKPLSCSSSHISRRMALASSSGIREIPGVPRRASTSSAERRSTLWAGARAAQRPRASSVTGRLEAVGSRVRLVTPATVGRFVMLRRRRWMMSFVIPITTCGCREARRQKASDGSRMSSLSRAARTLAERPSPVNRAISPTLSPGSIWPTTRRPASVSTSAWSRPRMSTYSAWSLSPWPKSRSPRRRRTQAASRSIADMTRSEGWSNSRGSMVFTR